MGFSGVTLQQILEASAGRVVSAPPGAQERRWLRMSALGEAGGEDIAFFFNKAYQAELIRSRPGVLVTGEPFVAPLQAAGLPFLSQVVLVASADPYLAMARISEFFGKGTTTVVPQGGGKTEIHPSAVVSSEARIAEGVWIGAGCVIEAGARIGERSVLYPNCFVGPDAEIGKDCVLFPQVVIYERVQIGDRVRVHGNTTLGSDGFGYAPIREGARVTGHQKIYHLGRVVIEDDVELGAGVTIDRGTLGETRVRRSAKIDNQVHIGHNAFVDEGAILCGGICLAGNARIGKFAYIGGMTGVVNEISVGDGAQVGACSLITKDIEPGGTGVGNPQRDQKTHFRVHAMLNRMARKKDSE